MRKSLIIDLDDCNELRHILSASPTPLAHVTAVTLIGLLAAVLVWIAATQVNLVVVTQGRVRSVAEPDRIFTGEQFNAATGGRVIQVGFREGDSVHTGQVLIRLDTRRIDNQIATVQRRIEADREGMAKLDHLETLLLQQFQTRQAAAQAELDQVMLQAEHARLERASKIQLAELTLTDAKDRLAWTQQLVECHAASPVELRKVKLEVEQALVQLTLARLPIDDAGVQVREQALQAVKRQLQVELADLHIKQAARHAQVTQAKIEQANLQLERSQAVIRATGNGVVVSKGPQVGDVVKPGQPIIEIAPDQQYRFDVALTSEDIGHVRVGMPVKVKLDAYDYQQYGTLKGKVVFVSPDSKSPTDTTGASTPLYTARITLDSQTVGRGDLLGQVKLGMTGRVEIVTDKETLLSVLLRKIRRTISFT